MTLEPLTDFDDSLYIGNIGQVNNQNGLVIIFLNQSDLCDAPKKDFSETELLVYWV